MRLLFDQNISYRILKILPVELTESSHVKKEGLINATDREIWKFAQLNKYTIVSRDSDFNDLNLLYGFPPKIIWVRTGNIRTLALLNILLDYYDELTRFIGDSDYGCFEILSITKK